MYMYMHLLEPRLGSQHTDRRKQERRKVYIGQKLVKANPTHIFRANLLVYESYQ